jgi:predicted flavoprotein YhiN
MLNRLKNVAYTILVSFILLHCSKQQGITPIETPPAPLSTFISFMQDTVPIKLLLTTTRKENIGNYKTTAVAAKNPDSARLKNSLIIRFTGDSARVYTNTEILATYVDSTGEMFSNTIADTTNKLIISNLEKKKIGIVTGNFTIKVSNNTGTKTYFLKAGIISSYFAEY